MRAASPQLLAKVAKSWLAANALAAQRCNLGLGQAQLAQDLAVVLAEPRRAVAHDRRRREPRRGTRLAQAAGHGMIAFEQDVARRESAGGR